MWCGHSQSTSSTMIVDLIISDYTDRPCESSQQRWNMSRWVRRCNPLQTVWTRSEGRGQALVDDSSATPRTYYVIHSTQQSADCQSWWCRTGLQYFRPMLVSYALMVHCRIMNSYCLYASPWETASCQVIIRTHKLERLMAENVEDLVFL